MFVDTEVIIDDICLIMPKNSFFKSQKNGHLKLKEIFGLFFEIWPLCDIYSQNMAIF